VGRLSTRRAAGRRRGTGARAYLCEIAISLESIQKSARRKFFENYNPSFNFTAEVGPDGGIDGCFQMGPNNASHPGLAPILSEKLLKARELGFKVIRMTNIGTVRSPEIPEDMLLTVESTDAYWVYAERLSNCSEFIKNLSCGYHDYEIIKQSRQPGSPRTLARAVAEWVDGDALSAHYAFNSDVFCTNDRGSSAGASSIFHPNNLAKLKKQFSIVVLSPDELSSAVIDEER